MPPPEAPATRRDLLRLAALATLAAGCDEPSTSGDAGTDLDASRPDAAAPPDAREAPDPADAPALDDLLAAEYRTLAAYAAGATILAAPDPADPLAALAPDLLPVVMRWSDQHRAHAAALRDAITALGATPTDPASTTFEPPPGFTPSVANVLKLACNAEKSLALLHTQAAGVLAYPGHRYLAGVIQGDETQHFVVLYVMLRGTAAPGPALRTNPEAVVPTSFVATLDNTPGLDTVPDLAFDAG